MNPSIGNVGSVYFDSIYPDVNVVSEILLEGGWVLEIRLPTIHLPCKIPLFDHRLKQICMCPLPVADNRRPDAYSMVLELPENIIDDLLHCSSRYLFPALWAVGDTDPGPQQA